MSLQKLYKAGGLECGLDEAGRGCLAGPVYAAAVILDPQNVPPGLDDSKKLTAAARNALRTRIENDVLAWAVAWVDAERIDEINILQASIEAMHKAVASLSRVPELLLVDGNRFNPYKSIPHITVIGGDGKYAGIAAASVLAKTHRDEFMVRMASQYPEYGWDKNKGYPTGDHISALLRHGPTPIHRKSFSVKAQTRLPF